MDGWAADRDQAMCNSRDSPEYCEGPQEVVETEYFGYPLCPREVVHRRLQPRPLLPELSLFCFGGGV